jgi:hypothetical protein
MDKNHFITRNISFFHILVLIFSINLLPFFPCSVSASTKNITEIIDKELYIKAAYVYNFARFVYWNVPKGDSIGKPINIYVLGSDTIGRLIEDLTKKQSNFRSIKVHIIAKKSNILYNCQILFIGQSEEGRLQMIFNEIKGRDILTVSEINDFAKRGGMIGFIKDEGKVKIEVNLNTVRKAGLSMSAKLLEISKIVSDGK